MIEVIDSPMPSLPLWRICAERRTRAGVKTECLGWRFHAASSEKALERAKRLGVGRGLKLVAIAEAS